MNCHRTQLFDIVNQYRAIFNNDKSGNEENYDGGLLFSWAMHQINTHLCTLEAMLPKIVDGGALSNILDQCMVSFLLKNIVHDQCVVETARVHLKHHSLSIFFLIFDFTPIMYF